MSMSKSTVIEVKINALPGMLGWAALIDLPDGTTVALVGHPTEASARKDARGWCNQTYGARRWRDKGAK